jgi:ribose 5-phosphate isomerase A
MRDELMQARERAASAAVAEIESNMVVGLGTGGTASRAIIALGERVAAGLKVVGVASSTTSAMLAKSLGITMRAPDEVSAIDVAIDGADEIDAELHLIKGGGGALTRERLVARAARRFIVVVDWEKRVTRLGERVPLPVEVLSFAPRWTLAQLATLGLSPTLRQRDDGVTVVTDNGGVIADCQLAAEVDLSALAQAIKNLPGVIDHGLFLHEATVAFVGTRDGVITLHR